MSAYLNLAINPVNSREAGDCKSLFLSLGLARAGFLGVLLKDLRGWGYGGGEKTCARKGWMQNKGLTACQERRSTTEVTEKTGA